MKSPTLIPDLDKSLSYFDKLVDQNGIIQFSNAYEKNYQMGYAIEDQARALIVSLLAEDSPKTELLFGLLKKNITTNGVKMLWYGDGRVEEREDNFGDASAELLWALGEYNLRFPLDQETEKQVNFLKKKLLKSSYTRVLAYSLLGLTKLEDKKITRQFADRLIADFKKNSQGDWCWFEAKLIYGNALLPWALLEAYGQTGVEEYKQIGLETLQFLLQISEKNGRPIVVGNKDWWSKGDEMPLYDQQPIDVAYLVLSCLVAFDLTQEQKYLDQAFFHYSWFLGNNLQGVKMIRKDGACFDGLNEDGPNLNSGAESHVCFLMASLKLMLYLQQQKYAGSTKDLSSDVAHGLVETNFSTVRRTRKKRSAQSI